MDKKLAQREYFPSVNWHICYSKYTRGDAEPDPFEYCSGSMCYISSCYEPSQTRLNTELQIMSKVHCQISIAMHKLHESALGCLDPHCLIL